MAEWRPLEILFLGIIVILGLRGQRRQFRRDCSHPFPPKRLVPPAIFSSLIVIGYVVYAISLACDTQRREFTASHAFELIIKSLVFTLLLIIKSYFGTFFVAYSFGGFIYNYFEYQKFYPWPILEPLIDWLFSGAGKWIEYAYMAITIVYALSTSIAEGFDVDNS